MAGTKPGHDGKYRKPFSPRIKSRPVRTYFTLCLPGSPKVNAGGACGAWLPGRELVRISASTTASRGPLAGKPDRQDKTSAVPEPASFAGTTFDEFCAMHGAG